MPRVREGRVVVIVMFEKRMSVGMVAVRTVRQVWLHAVYVNGGMVADGGML